MGDAIGLYPDDGGAESLPTEVSTWRARDSGVLTIDADEATLDTAFFRKCFNASSFVLLDVK